MYEVSHLVKSHEDYMNGLQHERRAAERRRRREAGRLDRALARSLRKCNKDEDSRPPRVERLKAAIRFLLF